MAPGTAGEPASEAGVAILPLVGGQVDAGSRQDLVRRPPARRALDLLAAATHAGQGLLVGALGIVVPLAVLGAMAGAGVAALVRPAEARLARPWRQRALRLLAWSTRAELARLRATTGVPLTDPAEGETTRLGAPATWRRLVYWLLRAPASFAQIALLSLVVVLPFVAFVGSLSALGGLVLPDSTVSIRTHLLGGDWVGPRRALAVGGLSLALAVAGARWLPGWLRAFDAGMAWALLAHTDEEEVAELTERVEELRTTREQAVDSAEAERRRIERDLHDGAQQRLVALSMLLGRAQARLDPATDATLRGLLAEARTETTAAIGEIRDLTRGLHPPVLTDRGLDAALSAVAARVAIPVYVHVDLPARPSITVESVVYFAVCEALTNVTKHAQASRAWVRIGRVETPQGDAVRAVVLDDGVGGAGLLRGTGLRGIADRLAGVDGRLELSSPPGGPTEFVALVPLHPLAPKEAPCAS